MLYSIVDNIMSNWAAFHSGASCHKTQSIYACLSVALE